MRFAHMETNALCKAVQTEKLIKHKKGVKTIKYSWNFNHEKWKIAELYKTRNKILSAN